MISYGIAMHRRALLVSAVSCALGKIEAMSSSNLLTCDIEMRGDWEDLVDPSRAVVEKVRRACLSAVALKSDLQPSKVIVENHVSDFPSIWLHQEPRTAAWIRLNVAPRAWCQLAYQFGHELGHVLANSWTPDANPQMPSQWIEEALAEGLSIYGLKRLSADWHKDPPFPGDGVYSQEIEKYLSNILTEYSKIGQDSGMSRPKDWYVHQEDQLENDAGLGNRERAFSLLIFSALQREPTLIGDYVGMNRWPERTGLDNVTYIKRWKESCQSIGLAAKLPEYIENILFIR